MYTNPICMYMYIYTDSFFPSYYMYMYVERKVYVAKDTRYYNSSSGKERYQGGAGKWRAFSE